MIGRRPEVKLVRENIGAKLGFSIAFGGRAGTLADGARSRDPMVPFKSNDPLHGVTLEKILVELSDHYGWRELGRRVPIRCFLFDPSIKSSLSFLRQTPWARSKVEEIYVGWKTAQPD
jgi:DNA-binding protein VF530